MGKRPKGQYVHSGGYILVSGGRHARYEHRIIAEQILGRPLAAGETVHHRNGDKTDNRQENLEVILSTAHHTAQHNPRRRVPSQCGFCGAALAVQPCRIKNSRSGLVFCGNSCKAKHFNGGGVRGRLFSPNDDAAIAELRSAGHSYVQIAKQLDRHRESIRTRALRLENGGIV